MAKIMIVDDSEFMRNVLRDILKKTNHGEFVEASSGKEALEKYESEKPDLVLLDIIMEEPSGIQVLRTLKKKHPQANIVMVSAVGQEKMIEEAKQLGVIEYVVKPFKEEQIKEAVAKALGK